MLLPAFQCSRSLRRSAALFRRAIRRPLKRPCAPDLRFGFARSRCRPLHRSRDGANVPKCATAHRPRSRLLPTTGMSRGQVHSEQNRPTDSSCFQCPSWLPFLASHGCGGLHRGQGRSVLRSQDLCRRCPWSSCSVEQTGLHRRQGVKRCTSMEVRASLRSPLDAAVRPASQAASIASSSDVDG